MNRTGEVIVSKANSEDVGGSIVRAILTQFDMAPGDLAKFLGTSLVSSRTLGAGDSKPDSHMRSKLVETLACLESGGVLDVQKAVSTHVFASRGARCSANDLPLFSEIGATEFDGNPKTPILSRLRLGAFWGDSLVLLSGGCPNFHRSEHAAPRCVGSG